MKKYFCCILSLIVAVSCLIGVQISNVSAAESTDASKEIDMYLIAGQSNAQGYSKIGSNTYETFNNVAYAGLREIYFRTGNGEKVSTEGLNFENIKWNVTAGLGSSSTTIGPEYGMAKVLNEIYTGDKKALIFKTAAGGTSLLDKTRELSEKYGNWYPRSLWETGYEPDITQNITTNDATGLLYKFFVENFRKVYSELVKNGYKPTVKAMVWMQGETDIYDDYEKYGDTLKTFISDIRSDIYQITEDENTKAMPFVIGKIASSFISYNNSQVKTLQQQQERVASEMSGVSIISTDDLIIVNQDGTINGTDKYHFNFNDAVTLGTRFAEKALEISDLKYVVSYAYGGSFSYMVDESDSSKITFKLSANEHYKLSSFKVNNVEYIDSVVDNSVTVVSDTKQTIAEAVFVEKEKYLIEYSSIGKAGWFQYLPKTVYEGEKLSLRLWLNEGYTAEKVMFGDSEMIYNSETRCYEVVVNSSGKVSVQLKIVNDNAQQPDNNTTAKNGCAGNLESSDLYLVAAVFVMLVAVLFVKNAIVKKKK